MAMDNWTEQSIRDAVVDRLGVAAARLAGQPVEWLGLGFAEADLRNAIGITAKDQKIGGRTGWFKRVDLAEELAGIVVAHHAAIAGSDLGWKIVGLRQWAHGNE